MGQIAVTQHAPAQSGEGAAKAILHQQFYGAASILQGELLARVLFNVGSIGRWK
jgi:hypothetical protein